MCYAILFGGEGGREGGRWGMEGGGAGYLSMMINIFSLAL
jgi:hypothetical protein